MGMARFRGLGFTLLEILLVLAIMGLLAGVALPRMQKLAESLEISNQRSDLHAAIAGLGYRAYASATPLQLESAAVAVSSSPGSAKMAVEIPSGWRLQVPAAIRYAANGVCSGGKLAIIDPTGSRETYVLKPPRCVLEPLADSE